MRGGCVDSCAPLCMAAHANAPPLPHAQTHHHTHARARTHAVCDATVMWRTQVFHSFDKMVSVFIHVPPMLVTYCLRWFAYPHSDR